MKPKVKLNHEYPTRGDGLAVVHFINEDGSMVGRWRPKSESLWLAWKWRSNGVHNSDHGHESDILFPRTVLVPVEIPEWANFVHRSSGPTFRFFRTKEEADFLATVSIDDWIASLEEK